MLNAKDPLENMYEEANDIRGGERETQRTQPFYAPFLMITPLVIKHKVMYVCIFIMCMY